MFCSHDGRAHIELLCCYHLESYPTNIKLGSNIRESHIIEHAGNPSTKLFQALVHRMSEEQKLVQWINIEET